VPADHIETLKQARENFVRKRRTMAEQMIPLGAATQHFAPAFADLQASVEAIDRAIADEEKLPDGYAAASLRHRRERIRTPILPPMLSISTSILPEGYLNSQWGVRR
jgi:hypothetical protein